MTTDTKKLGEFAAEFLGAKLVETPTGRRNFVFPSSMLIEGNSHIENEERLSDFIFNSFYSPILAHLALREMEKACDYVRYNRYNKKHEFAFRFKGDLVGKSGPEDKNYFIALWSAIEATGEK